MTLLRRLASAGRKTPWRRLAVLAACFAALVVPRHLLAAAEESDVADKPAQEVAGEESAASDPAAAADAPDANAAAAPVEPAEEADRQPDAAGSPAKPGQRPAASVQQAYQLSRAAKTADDFARVADLCEQALENGLNAKFTNYTRQLAAWAYNRRGETIAADGNDDAALADFEAALKHDPNRWQAIHNRGVCFAMQGNAQAAIADFDRTLKLNPRYANAYFNRGELLYEQGAHEQAIDDYNQAIRLKPRDSAAYNSRGHAYYRLGDYPQAVGDYGQAIRLDPQNAAAYTNRGDAYADRGQFQQAAADYKAAVRIDPHLGRGYQSAAWLMATCPDARYRNAEAALANAQKAIELDGDDDYRYVDTLAAAYANAGDLDQAKQLAAKVIEMVPQELRDQYQKRLAAYEAGKPYRDVLDPTASAGETKRRRRNL